MSIYNDFVRVNFPDVEGDDLLRLSGRAECAANSILNGVAAIGKMMFLPAISITVSMSQ